MNADLTGKIRERPADETRWAAWYRFAYPKVYYRAFRLARGHADTARELTQETFARFVAYRAIERVTDDQHAIAFLLKTCRNLAFNQNVDAHQLPLESVAELESIEGSAQASESILDLDALIGILEPQDRQILQWAQDGLSVAELARKLGVSYTAAGVRLHRIRERLRKSHG